MSYETKFAEYCKNGFAILRGAFDVVVVEQVLRETREVFQPVLGGVELGVEDIHLLGLLLQLLQQSPRGVVQVLHLGAVGDGPPVPRRQMGDLDLRLLLAGEGARAELTRGRRAKHPHPNGGG